MSSISANLASTLYLVAMTQTDFLNLIPGDGITPQTIRELAEAHAGIAAEWYNLSEGETAPQSVIDAAADRLEARAWDIIEAADIEQAAEYERQNAPGRYSGEYAWYASV